MALKIFKGFALDMAADLSGLEPWEVNRLRQYGVVKPKKTSLGYSYTFTDLLMLRLAKQLRQNGVMLADMKRAAQYLATIDPESSLNKYKLYIRSDTKEIVHFGEDVDKTKLLISLSEFGQLLMSGVLLVLPVGTQLEHVRLNVRKLDNDLDRSMKQKKVIPLQTALKEYGLA